MFTLKTEEFESIINAEIPKKVFNISDEKKVDILISLMKDLRININEWTERAYKATIWSIGLMFSLVGYWFLNSNRLNGYSCYLFIIAIIFIGTLTQIYLFYALKAHFGTGIALEKCQASLGLCDNGYYLEDKPFFGYSGKWLKSRSIRVLKIFNLFALIVLTFAVIFDEYSYLYF